MDVTKVCTVCGEDKKLEEFYNRKASEDGKSYRCKKCDNEARLKYKEKNYESHLLSQRRRNYKCKYGITIEDYDNMLKEQGGCCAICGSSDSKCHGRMNFAVDHCHETGKVRGLLCNDCNRALGLFQDSSEILDKAVKYLETH